MEHVGWSADDSSRAGPGRRRSPLAEGTDRQDLERLVRLLERSRIPFEVEEELIGDAAAARPHWRVLVAASDLLRARLLLAAVRQSHAGGWRPRTHPEAGPSETRGIPGALHEPAPGPLFEPRAPGLIRLLLALGCFALAAWIALS